MAVSVRGYLREVETKTAFSHSASGDGTRADRRNRARATIPRGTGHMSFGEIEQGYREGVLAVCVFGRPAAERSPFDPEFLPFVPRAAGPPDM
jgi:hypothetical protein